MESLFPAPFWEVLYSGHLQGNLSLLSPNHSLLPPHLLLNASHAAFLPLGLKVTIVGTQLGQRHPWCVSKWQTDLGFTTRRGDAPACRC